jgi:alkylation response protein AidB-like acyl-CoA dehydrogenase
VTINLTPASSIDAVKEVTDEWVRCNVPHEWREAAVAGDVELLRQLRTPARYREWYPTFAGSGLVAPTWPVQYGGLDLRAAQATVANQILSAAGLVRLGPIGLGLVGPTILEHGTCDQRARYLPRMVDNSHVWCQLYSEPGAGSDLAALSTRAVRRGEDWMITGQKVWSSFAAEADFGLLVARTDPDVPKHEGITCFALDMHAPGVTVRPLRQMSGDDDFNEVFFDEVIVNDRDRIGTANGGWQIAMSTLRHERVMLGGAGSGIRDRTHGRSIDRLLASAVHNEDRAGVWHDPIVRDQLARLWIETTVLRLTNMRTAQARRRGEGVGVGTSVAKLFQSEHNQRVQQLGVELLGPRGIAYDVDDEDADRMLFGFLRSRGQTLAGGTSEIQRNVIGERLLGLPKDPHDLKEVPWKDLPR